MVYRPVVFHDVRMDITPRIIDILHQRGRRPRRLRDDALGGTTRGRRRRAALLNLDGGLEAGQGSPGPAPRTNPLSSSWMTGLGMDVTRNQRTIAAPAAVEGCRLLERAGRPRGVPPCAAAVGIVFVRRDLPGCPRIAATIANRVETPLRTVLRRGEAGVEMIEHVMAALAGLQIDNCEVWSTQAEMPGCDGSSLPFVTALQEAGIVEQDAPRAARRIRRVIRLGDEQELDRGPARRRAAARPCTTSWTTAAATRSAGSRWNPALAAVLPPEPGPEPHLHAPARGGGPAGPGPGAPRHLPRPAGLRRPGADRQHPAIPRRVRPPQDPGHDRRPGPGRLRPGRAASPPIAAATASTASWSARSWPTTKGGETRRRVRLRQRPHASPRTSRSLAMAPTLPIMSRSTRAPKSTTTSRSARSASSAPRCASAAARGWRTTSR